MKSFSRCALCLVVAVAGPVFAASPKNVPRGGRMEWARLETQGPYWSRHADFDTVIVNTLREGTSLNMDAVPRTVAADKVDALAAYPFIYSENITPLTEPQAANLGEYLRRGGFLLIDMCQNREVNPLRPRFLTEQIAALKAILPGLEVGVFKSEHEVFSIFFKMSEFPPAHRGHHAALGNPPLYAARWRDRVVAVISLSGFQCAWSGHSDPLTARDCMHMVANIYVYAVTR